MKPGVSRRRLLTMGLITAAYSLLPGRAVANVISPYSESQKKLFLYHVHTQETLKITYWKDGHYIPDALSSINYIFRDTRTGKVKDIDPHLLDLLHDLRQKLGNHEPFCIVSGYRTPWYNAYLRKTTTGVARNSLHMYGKAVDIRIPGYNLWAVRLAAVELRRGGVGYYPHSHFIHLDVGSVRYWSA